MTLATISFVPISIGGVTSAWEADLATIGMGRCPRSGSVTAMTRPSRTFSAFAYVSAFVLASSMAFTRASTNGFASLKTKNSGPEISFARTFIRLFDDGAEEARAALAQLPD